MSSTPPSANTSPSSYGPDKAQRPSRKIHIQKARSPGSPGSSPDTAAGTATENRQAHKPWPRAGSDSQPPSTASLSPQPPNFRESRSHKGEGGSVPSTRSDHLFGTDDGVELLVGDVAAAHGLLAQGGAVLVGGLGDL